MINEQLIYDTTFTFLNKIFQDLFFHKEYQDNNEPEKPFGTVYIVSQNDDGSKKSYFDRDEPKEKIQTTINIMMQIEIYSNIDNVLEYANKVKANLRSDKAIYAFALNGFKIKKLSAIRSLPEQESNVWLYRRTFDLTLEAKVSDVFEVDYILEADVGKL